LLIAIFSAGFLISEKPLYMFKPKRLIILLSFIFRIMPREVWRSNLKLVKQVFSADIDIKTNVLRIPTILKSEYGLALLANSISTRPGTVVVDITEENNKVYLYIHCINAKGTRGKDAGDEIKGSIEKQVRRIFK
jgi:multicomponent Na+:H+ antiporter subunit E